MYTSRYKLHEDSITSADTVLCYRYYLSRRRRTLGLSVQADGAIIVRSPVGVPLQALRDFVRHQAGWIARTLQRMAERTCRPEPRAEREEHHYLGERYRLVVEQGEQEGVALGEKSMLVTIGAATAPGSHVRVIINRWYRHQAAELFRQRLAVCQAMLQLEGIPMPSGLVIRPMYSRWGSYSYRTGRVCLNLYLIQTPLHCLDYVIIHELCHARVRHHGPDFWRMIERFVPDHQQVRKELRTFTNSI